MRVRVLASLAFVLVAIPLATSAENRGTCTEEISLFTTSSATERIEHLKIHEHHVVWTVRRFDAGFNRVNAVYHYDLRNAGAQATRVTDITEERRVYSIDVHNAGIGMTISDYTENKEKVVFFSFESNRPMVSYESLDYRFQDLRMGHDFNSGTHYAFFRGNTYGTGQWKTQFHFCQLRPLATNWDCLPYTGEMTSASHGPLYWTNRMEPILWNGPFPITIMAQFRNLLTMRHQIYHVAPGGQYIQMNFMDPERDYSILDANEVFAVLLRTEERDLPNGREETYNQLVITPADAALVFYGELTPWMRRTSNYIIRASLSHAPSAWNSSDRHLMKVIYEKQSGFGRALWMTYLVFSNYGAATPETFKVADNTQFSQVDGDRVTYMRRNPNGTQSVYARSCSYNARVVPTAGISLDP